MLRIQTCQNKQGRHDLITCQKDSLIICKLISPRTARCHRWRQGENASYKLPLPLAQLHLRASVKSKAMRKRGFRQLDTALQGEPKIMGKTPVWRSCTPALYSSRAVTYRKPCDWLCNTPRNAVPCTRIRVSIVTGLAFHSHTVLPRADAQTPQPSLLFYVPTSDYIFRLKKPNHWSTEAV